MDPHQISSVPSDEPNKSPVVMTSKPSPKSPPPSSGNIKVTLKSAPRQILDFVSTVRIEIFFVSYVVAKIVMNTPKQDLLLQKACLYYLNYNDSICSHLDAENETVKEIKKTAESIANNYNMYYQLVTAGIGAIMSIFIGPWSDKYGQKVPLLMANFGAMVDYLITLYSVYNMPLPLYVNVLSGVVSGLSGNIIVILTCVYSYVTNTTEEKDRRKKFYIVMLIFMSSMPLGGLIGGFLYDAYGISTVLILSIALSILGLLWGLFVVKNATREQMTDTVVMKMKNFFSLDNMIDNLKVCVKPRPNKARTQILCVLGSASFFVFSFVATMGIEYYFVREMYSWTVKQYNLVTSISILINIVLNIPIIVLFTRVIKVSDSVMALIGTVFMIGQNVVHGLAYEEWIYYLHFAVSIPCAIASVGIRTLLSKLVEPHEVGKVFALLSSCESLLPIAGDVITAQIFNWSIKFMPGLVYLIVAAMMCIPFALLVYCAKVSAANPYRRMKVEAHDNNKPDPDIQGQTEA